MLVESSAAREHPLVAALVKRKACIEVAHVESEKRGGWKGLDALAGQLASETGVGIVRTSVGTVLGFSSLLLAESPGLQLLGAVVAIGSLLCMLSCLFVLAPLLRRSS